MAIPLLGLGLGAAGAIVGGLGSRQSQTVSRDLAPATGLERQATTQIGTTFGQLGSLVGAGAGQQDVAAGLQSSRSLAALLQQYAQGGFLPTAADTSTAQQFAATQFQPRALQLQQAFEQQGQRAAQLASQLGRPVNDPIIQARLAQEQMRQGAGLAAEQQAYSTQFAMNLPQQRLGYAAQLADVNQNLASQAMANRQALLSMGSQLQQAERNFRLGAAPTTTTGTSGGGLAGMLTGGIAGLGAGIGLMNMMGASTGGTTGGTGYLGLNTNLGGTLAGAGMAMNGAANLLGTNFSSAPPTSNYVPSAASFSTPATATPQIPYYLNPNVNYSQPTTPNLNFRFP